MYPWNPQDYCSHSTNPRRWAEAVISRIGLEGNERVLDIGCGDGKITAELARRLPRGFVLGVDLSPEVVRFARETFKRGATNLSFRQANASALPFQEEFDVVISFSCFHWIRNHVPVLEGIHRSLIAHGRVFLQFGGRGTEAIVIEMTEPVISTVRWSSYFQGFTFPWYFYSAEEYSSWMERAGLKPRRVELLHYEGVFTEEQLKGWVRSTWFPYVERVPGTLREAFISEVVDRCLRKHPLNRQGFVHLPFKRLEVEAEKT